MIHSCRVRTGAGKSLGMRTVLVKGLGVNAGASEATKAGDAPEESDPAVDAAVSECAEIEAVLPGLWQQPAMFVFDFCGTADWEPTPG